MDPMVTAAAVQTGGQVLGTLMGGKHKRPSWQPWIKAMFGADMAKNLTLSEALSLADQTAFSGKMKSAKDHGIHPLAMLGIPFGGSQAESFIGDTGIDGSAASDLGQGVGRAIEAFATKDERQMGSVLQKLAVERGQLENESLRSDIALKRAQLSPAFVNPSLRPMIDGQADTRYPEQKRMRMGFGDTAPFFREGKDANGDTIRVYNDELGDHEMLQLLTTPLSIGDIVANAGKRTGRWLRKNFKW